MGANTAAGIELRIGDGASPTEVFTPLRGVQITRLRLQHDAITSSEVRSHLWHTRREGAGRSSLEISLEGVYLDDEASAMLQAIAFSHAQRNMRLTLANDDVIEGAFLVTFFERLGAANAIETFNATLVNASIIALS